MLPYRKPHHAPTPTDERFSPVVYRSRALAEVPKKGLAGPLTEEQAAAFVRRENRFSIIRPGKHSKHFWAFRIIHT